MFDDRANGGGSEAARRHRARVGHLRRRAVGDGRIVLGIGDGDRNRDQRRLRGDVERCRRVDRLVVSVSLGVKTADRVCACPMLSTLRSNPLFLRGSDKLVAIHATDSQLGVG